MSHLMEGKMRYKDLGELKAAAEETGFCWMQDQREYNWYGQFMGDSAEGRRLAKERGSATFGQCEHALRLKHHRDGDYEVGVVSNGDGTYSLLYDAWGNGARLAAVGGTRMELVAQNYSARVVKKRNDRTLARQGFRMQPNQRLADGTLRLVLRRR